ncbi:MAG: hypothetical protein ACI9HK_000249 [Pirellulaceae bacterium]
MPDIEQMLNIVGQTIVTAAASGHNISLLYSPTNFTDDRRIPVMLFVKSKDMIFALAMVAVTTSPCWAEPAISYNRDIRPLLSDRCFKCHGPDEAAREAELRLDDEAVVFAKRDAATVVRGKPAASELVRRILSTDDDERMPPPDSNKSLSVAEKKLLQDWIAQGAEFEGHWAYIAPQEFAPPKVVHEDSVRNDVDRFVLKRVEEAKLEPSKTADLVTLIRRLSFDLTGLPPSQQEVEAFVNDKSPDAYSKLVDRLLKSEHFGERMAIYWLDVVRYADSNGYHSDEPRQIAPYRDYVIDSFNNNKPYDQFVVEQLAGDLIPEATMEQQIASGFNMLLQTTSEGGAQAKEYLAKYSADRVRNTTSIFLGATMGCAECHDHKFDPYTTKEFYSFAAFFADIQERGVGNPTAYPVATASYERAVKEVDEQIAALQKSLATTSPELARDQAKWEVAAAVGASKSVGYGSWSVIGPFPAASFDAAHDMAFPPEKEVDLAKTYDKLKWQTHADWKDGDDQARTFVGDNSSTYLTRIISSPADAQLAVAMGSDDSLKVWVNGSLVHNNKVARGVVGGQDKFNVPLKKGDNLLLVKVTNGSGGYGVTFSANQSGLPVEVVIALKVAAAERTDAQKAALANYYRTIAPGLNSIRNQLNQLNGQKANLAKSQPKSLMTKAGSPRPIRILPRGNWLDDSGPIVEPATPAFLPPLDVKDRRANRLDLAKWIVDKKNPLTARTFVNRLWKQFFGHGLATPLDDLGYQGTLPTHPELLDWLAIELMDSGWDTKHMIRLMVTSGTYQQSSVGSKELQQLDPYNQLYARQSRFRLEAEIVRDNALAISGLLVSKIGGPSVKPYQPAGYWRHMNFPQRTWTADQGENQYRRGLYTWWQRMFLHPSMLAFDAPSREECTVERPRSNTPLQALVLLNDPTYVEAARVFGERIFREGGGDENAKIEWAYRQALSRQPTKREVEILRSVFHKHLEQYKADGAAAKQLLSIGYRPMPSDIDLSEVAAWASVARVILNLHETISRG